MNRLQSYYEQLQVPLKAMFIASAFIAIGSIISNPYLNNLIKLDNPLLVTASTIFMMCGGIILSYFPLYVFVKLLAHEKSEPNIVVSGLMTYLVFMISMLIMTQYAGDRPVYLASYSVTINNNTYKLFNTGIFGFLAVFYWVRYVFRKPTKQRSITASSFLDGESKKTVVSIIGGLFIGLAFAWLWPSVLNSIYTVMNFISSDSNNPMGLFAYGALERIMSLGNVLDIIRSEFWFSDMGGTWMNLNGTTFFGDVNIWSGQIRETVNSFSAGRFTVPYYVLNLFAIPGYIVALSKTISNKKIRNRNLGILISVILLSVFGGILLPIELLMLLTSPTIYFFHIFMTSFIFAILRGFSVAFGFSYFGILNAATPGTLVDLFGISQNAVLFTKVSILVLLGVIIFVAYYAFTRFYFNKLALDILNTANQDQKIEDFVEALGGYENIESISSSITRIHVHLKDRDLISVAPLHREGVVRIVETRQGFVLSLGTAAYILQKEINFKLKDLVSQSERGISNES